ncbi:MaoC/PaaZ C-terminal domain-containing protein [Sporosarcina pasteurii]|uniref:(3R)-hydroxyacyl-ACP dehydratase subunit HadB n=1 Tax=Sporosarcina pasteurii TaxID=1474 RepID=A0A380C3R5_SPOPA|nr:MaoC/PaaZ C-terminal domain-containing protein [Sporosarcina pasteurii]MDS9471583.1 MaoC/PaaZ C-terminal domain-containing protein [Sporosarcina pasteurii]QBQ04802.1 dehydratase [Sporosarcina pasteurii]SUJ11202.1 (3R)-hydroxyacyl-ACP dehydratase subunit HadB [Sporosarcina pasteurii]
MSTITALQVGESLTDVQLNPVSRLDLIKYAGASGDFNPIHTIDEEATNAGLPGIIAHGMWTMGNLAKLFTPYVEEGFIKDYSIRFRGMVFLDDVITLKATLAERNENELTFNVVALNQHEKEVVKGHIVFQEE